MDVKKIYEDKEYLFLLLICPVALFPYKKLPGQALFLQLCSHVPTKVKCYKAK